MPYSPQTWADGPGGGTPLSSTRLNHIEAGVAQAAPVDPVITGILYDGSGNPTSVTMDGVVTTYTYNSDGTPNTQTRLGVTRTYAYSGGQLVSVT